MNTKKTPRKNLENKKSLFLEIGFAIALLMVLLAFQYRVTERVIIDIPQGPDAVIETVDMQNIIPPKPEPPKPPESTEVRTAPDDEVTDEPVLFLDVDVFKPASTEPIYFEPYDEPLIDNEIHFGAEIMPEYQGGLRAMGEYFKHNLKYPRMAQEIGLTGTVVIGFVIEKDGSVSNVSVIKGIGGGCDEEAVRVIQNMPPWIPGRQGTSAVRVRFSVPVVFQLSK